MVGKKTQISLGCEFISRENSNSTKKIDLWEKIMGLMGHNNPGGDSWKYYNWIAVLLFTSFNVFFFFFFSFNV